MLQRRSTYRLDDGPWWDAEANTWRNGEGMIVCLVMGADDVLRTARTKRVFVATAHRDHDTANNADRNLAAWCQRCHKIHDRDATRSQQ